MRKQTQRSSHPLKALVWAMGFVLCISGVSAMAAPTLYKNPHNSPDPIDASQLNADFALGNPTSASWGSFDPLTATSGEFRTALAQGTENAKPDTTDYYPVDTLEKERHDPQPADQRHPPDNSKTQWTLSDGFVSVAIDRSAGYIHSLSLVKSRRQLLPALADIYTLRADAATSYEGQESEDALVSVERSSKTELSMIFRNSKLPGITFRKSYVLRDGVLSKTVAVTSDLTEPRLFRVRMVCRPLQLNYSDTGPYGFGLPPGYFPENNRALFWTDRWPSANVVYMPAFVYPRDNVTTGVHIHRVNGRYIYARENDVWGRLDTTSLRWNMLAGGFVDSNQELSYEYHVRTVKGDAIAYHRSYKQLQGYRALFSDQNDPEWTDRVLMVTDCGPMDRLGDIPVDAALPPTPKWTECLLGDKQDTFLLWTLFGWSGPSAMPTEGNWYNENSLKPYPMNPQRVHWCLNWWRQGDPRRKVALYSWLRSYDPELKPFSSHPEWAALDAHGKPMRSFFKSSTFPVDRKPNYLEPGFREYILTKLGQVVSTYGVDSYYIDAEPGDGYPDWRTHTWFQPYNRYDFMKAGRHASGQELPLLKNTPNTPYATYYYWEGRGLYNEGMETRWRALGEKMLSDKVYQWEHRWTALMIAHGFDQEPYYSNYIVGLGFKPHARSLETYAYMQAGFEMRHLALAEAEFRPCFWRNEQTNIEAYLLKQGTTLYLSCIGHEKQSRNVTFELQPRDLPFTDKSRLFVWEVQMDDPHVMDPELKEEYGLRAKSRTLGDPEFLARFKTRRVARTAFTNSISFDESQALKLSGLVRPALLTMLAISPVPAIVLADGPEMTQMQVPCIADVITGGYYDERKQTAYILVQGRHSCTIGLLELKGLRISSIAVDGIKISGVKTEIGQDEYQSVELPAGMSAVKVRYVKEQSNDY